MFAHRLPPEPALPHRDHEALASPHLRQRSRAEASHSGKSKLKPDSKSLPGTTRRLFRISSVSVRMKNTPISSIQAVAGRPVGVPHAARKVRMNSAFGTGLGAARLTGPSNSSCSISQQTARTKS